MSYIMAIILAVLNPQVNPNYQVNQLPYASSFNEPQTWAITGSGTAVPDTEHALNGKALRVNSIADTTVGFSLNSQLNFIVPYTGRYVFSVKVYKGVLNGDDPNVIFEFLQNGINPYQIQCDLSGDDRMSNSWHYFAQSISLVAGQTISFKGSFTSGFADSTIWIDNLKLEYDPNGTGLPSEYMEQEVPQIAPIYTYGTVVNGATSVHEFDVPQAIDGNIVHYSVLNAIMNLGGHWGKAWVSAAGKVKIPYKNDTGADVMIPSAVYAIKIEK